MKKRAMMGLVAVFAVAALALAAGGCGSDDETTALTKAQFTKQADVICKQTAEESVAEYRARQAAQRDSLGTVEEREDLFRQSFVVPFQEMIGKVEDLGVPEGDEQELEAIFSEWERAGEIFEKDPLLLLSEPPTFAKANKLSLEYGFKSCKF